MLVFIVNGKPTAGKTTFEKLFIEEVNKINKNKKVKIISSIDYVKELCYNFWDGTKDEKARKGLSEMKKILNEWGDYCTKGTINKINNSDFDILFIDSREDKDIQFYKDYFGNYAYTLFIDRNVQDIVSNDSDKNINSNGYDIYINNNKTIEELRNKAKSLAAKCINLA